VRGVMGTPAHKRSDMGGLDHSRQRIATKAALIMRQPRPRRGRLLDFEMAEDAENTTARATCGTGRRGHFPRRGGSGPTPTSSAFSYCGAVSGSPAAERTIAWSGLAQQLSVP